MKITFGVAAMAMTLLAAQSNAATVFNSIDQGVLDANGTENFGATIDASGAFDHSFSFNTTGINDASGSVVTIRTAGGLKDLDFFSIDLDGVFDFLPTSGVPGTEPGESWLLFTGLIGAGLHTIHIHGTVAETSGTSAASYGATLNLTADDGGGAPEPATWALMILGFGAVGSSLRRRRPVTA